MNIVAAWATSEKGSGWANSPVWYLYYEAGMPKIGCLQPEEQTDTLIALQRIGAAITRELTAAVVWALHNRKEDNDG